MTAHNLLVNVQTPAPDDSVKSAAIVMLDQARAIVISNSAEYAVAAGALANIKGRWQTVEEQRVALKAPSLEGGRRVDAFFAPPLQALSEAEEVVKAKLDVYDKEQKRLAAVEQARLDDLARKEREKREAEARETQRVADEKAATARREAEAQRRAAEEALQAAEEAKRAGDAAAAAIAAKAAQDATRAAQKLDTKAATTEQRGAERVEFLSQQAASIVAPTVQIDIPKVAGLSTRKAYKAKVTDLLALVKAIAEGRAPLAYVMANEPVLNKMASALKEQMDIPGVVLDEDTIKSSKAAR